MEDIKSMQCRCGAVTVQSHDEQYSMPKSLYLRLFDGLAISDIETSDCDYCVRNEGVDLCGCGSGDKFGECQEGLQACLAPAQPLYSLQGIAMTRNFNRFSTEVLQLA